MTEQEANKTQTQPIDRGTKVTGAIGHMTGWLGSFPAILGATALVVVWLIGGLSFGVLASNLYQLLINTTTTIVTFVMVFIIQNTQNRDGAAVQAKLDAQNEVLRAIAERLGVDDDEDMLTRLVGIEDAPARVISADHDRVRRKAVESGRHGLAQRGVSAGDR